MNRKKKYYANIFNLNGGNSIKTDKDYITHDVVEMLLKFDLLKIGEMDLIERKNTIGVKICFN